MFVPVSPSGTGYTLSLLIPALWASRASRYPTTTARRSSAPRRVNVIARTLPNRPVTADHRRLAAEPAPQYPLRVLRTGHPPVPMHLRYLVMAAVCEICGKHPSFGMNVSHSHRRTKRRWNPNIQRIRAVVDGTPKRLHVCTGCIKAGKVQKKVS